jgi:hypothetical protein
MGYKESMLFSVVCSLLIDLVNNRFVIIIIIISHLHWHELSCNTTFSILSLPLHTALESVLTVSWSFLHIFTWFHLLVSAVYKQDFMYTEVTLQRMYLGCLNLGGTQFEF